MDAHTVSVTTTEGERRVTADYILIATGSKPHRPADIDFSDPFIHDSDEILTIDQMPTSMTILGGGVIGCEYAGMFRRSASRSSSWTRGPRSCPSSTRRSCNG